MFNSSVDGGIFCLIRAVTSFWFSCRLASVHVWKTKSFLSTLFSLAIAVDMARAATATGTTEAWTIPALAITLVRVPALLVVIQQAFCLRLLRIRVLRIRVPTWKVL